MAASLRHDDFGPQLAIMSIGLVMSTSVFLLLRIMLKIKNNHGLWWDDYLLVASWVTLTAGVVLNVIDIGLGYGRHTWDVPPQYISRIVTNGTISGTLFILAAAWSKTSFAFTLLRLPIGWIRYFIWFIIVTLNIAMHLSAISIFVECPFSPPDAPSTTDVCLPIQTAVYFGIVVGGYSATADFTLALLPWKFLWNLQMQRREKIGVLIAMSMGVFAGMAAVLKTTKLSTLKNPDIIEGVQLAAWATVEVGVTIMAASIPILRALFRRRSDMPVNYVARDTADVTPERPSGASTTVGAATLTSSTTCTLSTYPRSSRPDSLSHGEEKRWPLVSSRMNSNDPVRVLPNNVKSRDGGEDDDLKRKRRDGRDEH